MPLPIIIDTDPGIDDAIALMVAARAPGQVKLRAVTTVGGNVGGRTTFRNARALMAWLGSGETPVLEGCPAPMLRRMEKGASQIHGGNGLGGIVLPEPAPAPSRRHAAPYLVDACRSAALSGARLTLCPIGPLTNIAAALVMAPDMVRGVDRIVLMGGTAEAPGNVSPAAEFNIWADPHAAEIVFSAPVEKVMIGLDVTEQVPAADAWIEGLAGLDPRVGPVARDMLASYQSRRKALHDPCVIAYLMQRNLFSGRRARVSVDLSDGPDSGRTLVAWDGAGDTEVLMEVDAEGVRTLIEHAIAGDYL
ncbi:MAG: nucleoside hydrolase [Alphaproteobacteria bacterium]|nr:nucleoside hydrolase [Alphaproteobacteria bacterium]